jgi:putative transposase
VILDAFSRRVIGWALDRTLEDTLTLRALRMALQQRRPAPGLMHHSDRGVQYASGDYTDLLRAQGILISMSRKANPYDHAKAESFMKTLKYEEVYRQDYRDLIEASAVSWNRFTTRSVCTRLSAIVHPPSSSSRCGPNRPQQPSRS